MKVVVCIPFRGGDSARERNFEYVHSWWRQFPYPIRIAEGPEGLFNRSAARNQAAEGDWDVALFGDADTVGQPENIVPTIRAAAEGKLAYPFTRFEGLNPQQTRLLFAGKRFGRGKSVRYPSPGGILAVSRTLFETVGGYDEAFQGWGYEDLAFACAARTLGGQHREEGSIFHLWHPNAPEKKAAIATKTPNRARKDRYKQADGNPEAMRALLEELK
jgi:hypothetical protein